MNFFKGLIVCELCGKYYNRKDNNGTVVFLCQTRKNKSVRECDAPIIHESFLIDVISQHCKILNKQYEPSKTRWFVEKIIVREDEIKILYKDGNTSTIKNNQISFV